MKSLKPAELKDPSVAAYYSAILTANGQAKEAQEYRELARKATLLREEEQMLNLLPVEIPPTPAATESTIQPITAP